MLILNIPPTNFEHKTEKKYKKKWNKALIKKNKKNNDVYAVHKRERTIE